MAKEVTKYIGFIENYMPSDRDPEAVILPVKLIETEKMFKLPHTPENARVTRKCAYKTNFSKLDPLPFSDTWDEAFQRLLALRTREVTAAERALTRAKYHLELTIRLEKPSEPITASP